MVGDFRKEEKDGKRRYIKIIVKPWTLCWFFVVPAQGCFEMNLTHHDSWKEWTCQWMSTWRTSSSPSRANHQCPWITWPSEATTFGHSSDIIFARLNGDRDVQILRSKTEDLKGTWTGTWFPTLALACVHIEIQEVESVEATQSVSKSKKLTWHWFHRCWREVLIVFGKVCYSPGQYSFGHLAGWWCEAFAKGANPAPFIL